MLLIHAFAILGSAFCGILLAAAIVAFLAFMFAPLSLQRMWLQLEDRDPEYDFFEQSDAGYLPY
jgi:hypothetical protein